MSTDLRRLRLHTLQRYATWLTSAENEGAGWRAGVAPFGHYAIAQGPIVELELGYRAAAYAIGCSR